MPDRDGYPTDDELATVKNWRYDDPNGLLDYIETIWQWPEWGVEREGKIVRLHTGGWSGNEAIVRALQENFIWIACWQSSKRGGHYEFHCPHLETTDA